MSRSASCFSYNVVIMVLMEIKFHLRARALVYKDGNILVARVKEGKNTFLPGGHVQLGEKT